MSSQGYVVLQMVTFWVTVGLFLTSCNFFSSNLQNVLTGYWDFPGQAGWGFLSMAWNNMIYKGSFNPNHSMTS